MGDCQNYGPFLGPYYNTGPNFDNPPYEKYVRKFFVTIARVLIPKRLMFVMGGAYKEVLIHL